MMQRLLSSYFLVIALSTTKVVWNAIVEICRTLMLPTFDDDAPFTFEAFLRAVDGIAKRILWLEFTPELISICISSKGKIRSFSSPMAEVLNGFQCQLPAATIFSKESIAAVTAIDSKDQKSIAAATTISIDQDLYVCIYVYISTYAYIYICI